MRSLALLLVFVQALHAERAVRRDGSVVEKEVSLAVAEGRVKIGRKSHPLEEFCLVEQDDGRHLWSPDPRSRRRGYEHIARARACATLSRLAGDAARRGLGELAAKLLDEARASGLGDKEAEAREKEIAASAKRSPATDEAPAIAKQAEAVHGLFADLLAERAATALSVPESREDGLALLRESLLASPDNARAKEVLAREAPADFKLGDARFWLDWHLDLELLGVRLADENELDLKRARAHWRPDLYGLVAPPVLLITPLRNTRAVGRCLAYGRLACETLGNLFATDKPMKRSKALLTIFLHADKNEYKKYSGLYAYLEDRQFLEWTVGHYSPSEQISRFFWLDDPDAERRIAGTCIHELTHHWIEEQNPRFAASQSRSPEGGRSTWIVEGFATFMDEGRYSAEKRTADLFNPRSRSLDVVEALSRSGGLMPWDRFYGLPHKEFRELGSKWTVPVVRRWSCRESLLSERRVFYEQGAATCAYLFHAQGGKYREKLLEYVVAHYTGQTDKLDIQTAFGMAPEELGRNVVEFARAVAGGWRP